MCGEPISGPAHTNKNDRDTTITMVLGASDVCGLETAHRYVVFP